jgi:hypothetical protein
MLAGGIPTVIQAMQTHNENPTIQDHACCALSNISLSISVGIPALVTGGGIAVLVQTMAKHADRVVLLEAASAALSRIAAFPQNRSALASSGGVALVASSMRRHSANAGIQEEGVALLGNMSGSPNNQISGVKEADGLATIFAVIDGHARNVTLQAYAYGSLCNMLSDKETRLNVCTQHQDGVSHILRTLSEHLDNPDIQARACRCLLKLAKERLNREILLSMRIVPKLLAFLQVYPLEVKVRAKAYTVLSEMARDLPGQVALVESEEGVATAVSSLTNIDASEAGAALVLVINLCAHPDGRAKVFSIDGVSPFVTAMQSHVDNCAFQEHLCGALCNLWSYAPSRPRIASDLGMSALVASMSTHLSQESLQLSALGLLVHMTAEAPDWTPTVAEIRIILTCIKTHHGSRKVVEKGCIALANLASHPVNRATIAAADGIPCMLATITLATSGAVHNLANDKACRDLLERERAIPKLLVVMETYLADDVVQSRTCSAISHLLAQARDDDAELYARFKESFRDGNGRNVLDAVRVQYPIHEEIQTKIALLLRFFD